MTVWVVSPGWLVVAEGCCVRIGSHDDGLTGRGGVMWRGLAVLCEDCSHGGGVGGLERRFGLDISAGAGVWRR